MLNSEKVQIERFLDEVRRLMAVDFAGLAWYEELDFIRWRFASGNRNDRYRRITLRLGKGIAGKVIRSGRMMVIEDLSQLTEDIREYPIFLSEGLQAAVGAPVTIRSSVLGVLLAGNRYSTIFSSDQLELIQSFSEQLGTMLSEMGVFK